MTDSQQEKVQKLYENRLKAQTELHTLQQKILDSIANGDRRVPQPVRGQVTLPSTTAAQIVTTMWIFAPIIPIQSGGTTFY